MQDLPTSLPAPRGADNQRTTIDFRFNRSINNTIDSSMNLSQSIFMGREERYFFLFKRNRPNLCHSQQTMNITYLKSNIFVGVQDKHRYLLYDKVQYPRIYMLLHQNEHAF